MSTKRLRVFAGPNGSGKSTIYDVVNKKVGCHRFVNADNIERKLRDTGKLSFNDYIVDMKGKEAEFKSSFVESGLFEKSCGGRELLENISITQHNILSISRPELVDSYFAAFIAEYLRFNMLNIVESFTIETVMSDTNKLEYIKTAKKMGYRIYLYFVSTKDVSINIDRVGERIQTGGHGVPEEKIRKRYVKSLENLYDAVKLSDRAYVFDNSDAKWELIGTWDGEYLYAKDKIVPKWFEQYLVSKLTLSPI